MGRRILVVGGNAAGLSAAARAKREDPGAEVVVFETTQTPSVSNCNFSYVLSGRVNKLTRVLSHPPKYFTERGIDLRTGVKVLEVDPVRRRVKTESDGASGEESCDRLVYCADGPATAYRRSTPTPIWKNSSAGWKRKVRWRSSAAVLAGCRWPRPWRKRETSP